MAHKIQVVVMDSKDYILEYRDFKYSEIEEMIEYVKFKTVSPSSTKIHIRKWNL